MIAEAAALIRAGRLVAFPTETVYGLGANALDVEAVRRIFTAKGRPLTSPLIVHVDSIAMAKKLTRNWPETAQALAEKFWPGPLTLVVEKTPEIPDIVTAGLPTAGLRMPAHPMALALIREAGVPIAAPSANRFTQLSPTVAEHVPPLADMVLDGGPATIGIESTVLSLAGPGPVLLRPGMITREQIEAVIGPVEEYRGDGAHPSPGMHPRHYSPSTPLFLVNAGDPPRAGDGARLSMIQMPRDPAGYAARLYETLHKLDAHGFDWIEIERPPDDPAWAAILDRLRRAAHS